MTGRRWALLCVAVLIIGGLAAWWWFWSRPEQTRPMGRQGILGKPGTMVAGTRPTTAPYGTPGQPPASAPSPSTTLPPPPKGEDGKPHIIIVPVSKSMKRRMEHKFERFSPMLALTRRGKGDKVPERIEITERTEFYAFFIDPTGKYNNKTVVFQWFHQTNPKPFARPVSVPVMKLHGYKWPMAFFAIWSAPPSARGLMSFMNYRSVRSRADWDRSRCWGPRTLIVSEFKGYKKGPDGRSIPKVGKTIAEAHFEIHQRGVTVY